MREVNFSIPNVNKASVHITTTLYDRRALDCTSTLPLINSLNHLAYLTTSSARIRDILVIDGGVERLVDILKEGRGKDMMDVWKWNLAFQCVVNIGVRGSEQVRSRVVEADVVPVIATILDNYIQLIDKERVKVDTEQTHREAPRFVSTPRVTTIPRTRADADGRSHGDSEARRSRRQPPPALDIRESFTQPRRVTNADDDDDPMEVTPTRQTVLTSPPERTTFSRPRLHHHHSSHHHHRSHEGRNLPHRNHLPQPLTATIPSIDTADGFAIRPVRDVDRLPSMLPPLQVGNHSQPESPTTPSAPPQHHQALPSSTTTHRHRRPPGTPHRLPLDESDDNVGDESAMSADEANNQDSMQEVVEVQTGVLDDVGATETLLDGDNAPLTLTIPETTDTPDAETFNITHRHTTDGSILATNATPVNGQLNFSPIPPAPPVPMPSPVGNMNGYAHLLRQPPTSTGFHVMQPRDEDILMSLQLLAYISKYCNLRPHFQATHLVPSLCLGRDVRSPNGQARPEASLLEQDEEYLQTDDYNTFPLVEKFTARHHSKDMQYWAFVVMRNLCRRDDSRGGIRQCAYHACGRWEKVPRQFAKCRRCRRTKYCSKDCQKNAWIYHRHWCHAPS
jgi:hypothetical protein